MANFSKIERTAKSDDLINRSVIITARRWLPSARRWSVQLNTGWYGDSTHVQNLSRDEVRQVSKGWLTYQTWKGW